MALLFIWWLISYLLFFSHYWLLRHNKSWHFASDMNKKISKRSSPFESSEWDRGISMGQRQWEKSPLPFFFLSQLCSQAVPTPDAAILRQQWAWRYLKHRYRNPSPWSEVQKVWEMDGHLCQFLTVYPSVTCIQPNLASGDTQ